MSNSSNDTTRRSFLKSTAEAGTAMALMSGFSGKAGLYAAGDEKIRVGLVGCGGRGSGAANQALNADPNAVLVAMGDAFPEKIESSIKSLKAQKAIADRVQVDEDHQFSGLDAFRYVIDSCDVVILATPPGFRPEQFEYAVEKGKHIFTEKPMATDAPGVRRVMAAVKRAQEKNLAVVAGFCWRYDSAKRAFFEKVLAGDIGDVLCSYGTYLTNPVKTMPDESTRPEGMSDLEWMVRNWYNFTWLSGDGLVEQACHTVDWIAWSKGDKPPVSCTAVGGRQVPAKGGNIFDHIEVNYLWEDDTRAFMAQRQISGCHNENNFYVLGSKGKGTITRRGASISGAEDWRYKGPTPNMYQVEHNEMFKSIREGNPIDNGERMVTSTMMAIMGRMAGYTGKEVTWDMAWNSEEKLVPEIGNWDTPVDLRPMAIPGATLFE
ncbi:Glycosyl hydrolase family 109 protein 1 precursor [Thalassoglobus neptunius]|uniref:Glycosyl hydrolase family 109 protein 1 n=1 Tax=Thalassoglobus neptunius TaxID=1938619 RepID=A0A5C5WIP0_9PLAN|nr:Gfo/Idh/MocA family oxidoreductase [Thalassoglobus neptunius]TWT49893.1 Glycosyl hydrolase family 109 protein 1 precursor [Thalassoglobus neptunius]